MTPTTIAMTARAATIPPTIAPVGAAVVRRKITIMVKNNSSLTFETNTQEREERSYNVKGAAPNNRHILGAGPCFKQQTGSCSTQTMEERKSVNSFRLVQVSQTWNGNMTCTTWRNQLEITSFVPCLKTKPKNSTMIN